MRTNIEKLFLPCLLATGLGLFLAGHAQAQTLTVLHTFTNGSDGGQPVGTLIVSGNILYGTTYGDNSTDYGTAFAVNIDGTDFTTLHIFTNGSDGAYPIGGLTLSGNTLFGTAQEGGSNGYGGIFAVNTNGTCFTNVYSFTGGANGASPNGGLVVCGSTLYGTCAGGNSDYGLIFAVHTDGTDYTKLHDFTNGPDGAYPLAGLISDGGTLYGTTFYGGVFAVNTDGTGFTNLHRFSPYVYDASLGAPTNGEGWGSVAGLILSGDTLYGTASDGGTNGSGTLFAVNTNGANFTVLYTFPPLDGDYLEGATNADGGLPFGGLVLSGNTLYGTTQAGGTNGFGTIFALATNGACFSNLYDFTATSTHEFLSGTNWDGANPRSSLSFSGGAVYGAANGGGADGYGTVFGLSLGPVSGLQPQLNIVLSGTNVILTWTNNGFTLRSTTSLPPVTWSTNLPAPVIINGRFTVTNRISATQQFYELSQ